MYLESYLKIYLLREAGGWRFPSVLVHGEGGAALLPRGLGTLWLCLTASASSALQT